MAATSSLVERIDAEFSAAQQRLQQLKDEKVQEFHGRQQRLEKLEQILEELPKIWRPRLETLAQKLGERVKVQPNIEPGRRSGTFNVQSDLASIKLRFGAAPDPDVKNLHFTYDLEIIPVLMKFESHSETEFPLEAIDHDALASWIDDRIVSFVQTYLAIQQNQYYLKDHMVEDPVAKVRFPKYAAGATCEHKGKTHYFIDDETLKEFQQQQK
jgi:YHS domain-containing protein